MLIKAKESFDIHSLSAHHQGHNSLHFIFAESFALANNIRICVCDWHGMGWGEMETGNGAGSCYLNRRRGRRRNLTAYTCDSYKKKHKYKIQTRPKPRSIAIGAYIA